MLADCSVALASMALRHAGDFLARFGARSGALLLDQRTNSAQTARRRQTAIFRFGCRPYAPPMATPLPAVAALASAALLDDLCATSAAPLLARATRVRVEQVEVDPLICPVTHVIAPIAERYRAALYGALTLDDQLAFALDPAPVPLGEWDAALPPGDGAIIVAWCAGRAYLMSGTHRALALRARGVRLAPAYCITLPSLDALPWAPLTTLDPAALRGANPPTCRHHLRALRGAARQRAYILTLRVPLLC